MKEAKDGMKQEALAMMGDPTAEKPQTQLMDMFYMMYEAEAGADFNIFNVEAAKDLLRVENLYTGRQDFEDWCMRFDSSGNSVNGDGDQYPACQKRNLSPLRFLYASEFDSDKAQAVITELQKPDLMQAHKIMGPCFDNFHRYVVPQDQWPLVGRKNVTEWFGRSCDGQGLVSDQLEEDSFRLSQLIVAVTMRFDGKAQEPVSDMDTLSKYIAHIKELPSQAMFVDFNLDNKFNTNNTKCKFTRSILPFGGPLDRAEDGVRIYMNTTHKEEEQKNKIKRYILDELYDDFKEANGSGYSDKITVYYFMTALIMDIIIDVSILRCTVFSLHLLLALALHPHSSASSPSRACAFSLFSMKRT